MKLRRNQSGVALVITLIMLSVITIIAVAFLALSQRERASLSQTLTGTEAELVTATGLERAKSHVLAEVAAFLSTNTQVVAGRAIYARPQGTDLAVSKAFTNSYNNWTNMGNLDYQVLTNLFYDPPVPVFTTNNSGAYELVDYLDLNRNRRFDPTGVIDEIDDRGNRTGQTNYFAIGDPQWIGVLARPNEPHSSSNRFIGRYAYIILPAGRTLDIDFIHNHAKPTAVGDDGFYRTQGHGTWEINLAAFLADLNNGNAFWGGGPAPYDYLTNIALASTAPSFLAANEMLSYRYAGRPDRLLTARTMFGGGPNVDDYRTDGIDQYVNGNGTGIGVPDNDNPDRPWPGASNPQRFFSIHDFFNPLSPSIQQFQNRMTNASGGLSTYNAHTFYRMLAQLGTDSAPEGMRVRRNNKGDFIDSARINLNYENTNDTVAAQFIPWNVTNFFHTAADRLLRTYGFAINNNTALSVTNLPIYPTNFYTPAVHRILQMTLNIFDATTNQGAAYPYYPTAMKPIFESSSGGEVVKIVGYERVPQNNWAMTNAFNWRHLSNATDRAALNPSTPNQYVYGVPILIGAKKGLPNFNEYVLQSVVQVERKVNIEKLGNVVRTNQFFFMGISNVFGMEAWNSYSSPYPRDLVMVAGLEQTTVLTNNDGFVPRVSVPNPFVGFSAMLLPANTWRGGEFQIPLAGLIPQNREGHSWTNETFLTNAIYSSRDHRFYPTNQIQLAIDPNVFAAPQWVLTTTNRLRFFLFDNGHLIDAVGLAPSIEAFNITESLHRMSEQGANDPSFGAVAPDDNYWLTTRMGGAPSTQTRVPTRGLQNQIDRARRGTPAWGGDANRSSLEAQGFRQFLAMVTNPTNDMRTNMWVPFVPQQKVYHNYLWQANDPLVHYLAEDLRFKTNSRPRFSPINNPTFDLMTVGQTNGAYQPWGGPLNKDPEQRSADVFNPRTTDMNIRRSDDWDFPTNSAVEKFATIGLLGRVHRGTPWQTVYFKSDAPDDGTWAKLHQGGRRSNPTNDWRLADVFTVAQHPNASRGRLSVNQTNVAAWSAIFSGIEIPTLRDVGGQTRVTNIIIEPVINDPNKTVEKLVRAMNFRRSQMTGEVFSSLSAFLSVPELTSSSLFLTQPFVANPPQISVTPLRDRDLEAIPEKILSLVHRGEPRFVIYAFGQSLKPAAQSIITGGDYRGLVTNYEVTGELASKTVLRVELDERNNPPAAPVPRAVVETFNILPPD